MNPKLIPIAFAVTLSSLAHAAGVGQFDVRAVGNFKRMFHSGDASGKVALTSVATPVGVYGVGALADLRGEILIWDGRVLVTRGESSTGSVEPPTARDQATLLVTGRVKGWHEVGVSHDMAQDEFEQFVIDAARQRHIDVSKPFPFAARGEITNYLWHVVIGKRKQHGADSKHQQGHANKRTFSGAKTTGMLVGFYSAEELEGIISHPGERFHIHYADKAMEISGHLDRFGVGKGLIVLLPKQ